MLFYKRGLALAHFLPHLVLGIYVIKVWRFSVPPYEYDRSNLVGVS